MGHSDRLERHPLHRPDLLADRVRDPRDRDLDPYLFIYLLINIKIDKSVIPHQCISGINEADIVENKIEITWLFSILS